MGTKGTWRRPAAISDAEMQKQWDAWFAGQGPLPAPNAGPLPKIDEPPPNR